MSYEYEGDTQLFVHLHKLQLHLLAHLVIKGAQWLIQQQYLGLIDDSPCYGNSLLLSTGEGINTALLKAFKIHDLKSVFYLLFYLCCRHFFDL